MQRNLISHDSTSLHLESKQVVHGADDNINGGRVPRLSSQEVLEIWN